MKIAVVAVSVMVFRRCARSRIRDVGRDADHLARNASGKPRFADPAHAAVGTDDAVLDAPRPDAIAACHSRDELAVFRVDGVAPAPEVFEKGRGTAAEDPLVAGPAYTMRCFAGVDDPQRVVDAGRDALEVRVGAPQRLVLARQRAHQNHQHHAAREVDGSSSRARGSASRSDVRRTARRRARCPRGIPARAPRRRRRSRSATPRTSRRTGTAGRTCARAEQRIEQPAQHDRGRDGGGTADDRQGSARRSGADGRA